MRMNINFFLFKRDTGRWGWAAGTINKTERIILRVAMQHLPEHERQEVPVRFARRDCSTHAQMRDVKNDWTALHEPRWASQGL